MPIGQGMDWLGDVVATWFLVAVFSACGAAVRGTGAAAAG